MKKILSIAFLSILSAAPAYAEGGHDRGHDRGHGWRGSWIAPALIGGVIAYDLAYPRTIYEQPYVVYTQPYPVYAPSAAPPSVPYWYFCPAANAYYPYVSSCPSGWQVVPATPPVTVQSVPYGAPPR